VSALGRLFCDGQLCFYTTTVAASTGGDLITEFGKGGYLRDLTIQLSIVAMGFAFVMSTFFFGVLTFAEDATLNKKAAIWTSIILAIGTTALAGSIRWWYKLY
jgi:hypothetical protein